MANPKIKNVSSSDDKLKKWKQSAMDNCIARGLLEIRADKQQLKIQCLEGTIQDLEIENKYLRNSEEQLKDIICELETEPEEEDHGGYEEKDEEEDDTY